MPPTPGWSRWLSPLLLQGEVSIWHVWSALGFVVAIVAYVVFLASARLTPRVMLDASRIRALSSRDHRTRWQSINVGIYWIGFLSLLALVASGTAIYLNVEGLDFSTLTTIHRAAAWMMLSYMALHIGGQIVMGGATQIMKILRPRLAYGVPAVVAAAAALAAGAGVSMLDQGTISALPVNFVRSRPDSRWRGRRPGMDQRRSHNRAHVAGRQLPLWGGSRDDTRRSRQDLCLLPVRMAKFDP